MFYSQEKLIDIFRFQFRKQSITVPVIRGLAGYAKGNELYGIMFVGAYEDMEAVAEAIKKVEEFKDAYAHCVIDHEGKHNLIRFMFKPYD